MPIAVINGAKLRYEETGEGEPVLFIHGTGAHSPIAWDRCVEQLPRTRRLITYDRRGFGRSGGPLARRLSEHIDDAAALLRELEASPAAIVSQSGGGVVALRLQARYPDLVTAMVMTEPAYQVLRHPSPSVWAAMAKTLTRWLVRRDPKGAAVGLYRWTTGLQSGGQRLRWLSGGVETGRRRACTDLTSRDHSVDSALSVGEPSSADVLPRDPAYRRPRRTGLPANHPEAPRSSATRSSGSDL